MAGGQNPQNVNQAAASGLQAAGQTTQAGMNYMPQSLGVNTLAGTDMGQYQNNYQPQSMANPTLAGTDLQQYQNNYQTQSMANPMLAGTNLQQYQNPYQQQVIDNSLNDLERTRKMQMNSLGASASQAGAFGGSRQGVAQAQTNEGFARQAGNLSAGLNQQGYNNAQNAAQFDINNQRQASQFDINNQIQRDQFGINNANQNAQFDINNRRQASQFDVNNQINRDQFGINNANQNAQFDINNQMNAGRYNIDNQLAGAGLNLGAASQLGNLSNLGFGMGQQINNSMLQQGTMQQGLQQQLIDAARGQYGGYTGSPMQSLSAPLAALGATPDQSTTTQTKKNGLFDYLSLGLGTYAQLCWVAREVYGHGNPMWVEFREYMLNDAPAWLRNLYVKHGPAFAGTVRRNPWMKRVLRPLMDMGRRKAGY